MVLYTILNSDIEGTHELSDRLGTSDFNPFFDVFGLKTFLVHF